MCAVEFHGHDLWLGKIPIFVSGINENIERTIPRQG
jgi:hypothetical protein